mmetsp:Transcript_31185/g.81820  ORF Transcript_31185/g.81820 Transcript_31185/m.81820 type:complete len:162 (-) Transcript_31185:297-782(-)
MILLCSFCHVCTLFGSNTLQKIADDSVCHHCMRAIDVANGQEKKDFLKCAYCESVVHFECDGMGKDLREILESRDSIGYKCLACRNESLKTGLKSGILPTEYSAVCAYCRKHGRNYCRFHGRFCDVRKLHLTDPATKPVVRKSTAIRLGIATKDGDDETAF